MNNSSLFVLTNDSKKNLNTDMKKFTLMGTVSLILSY